MTVSWLVLTALLSTADTQVPPALWLPGSTPHGPAGMHRVMYGHGSAPSGLSFAGFADFAAASNLLFPGDTALQTQQSIAVLWTLNSHVEVGAYVTSNIFTDSVFAGAVAFNTLPGIVAKWNAGVWRGWAGGLYFNWTAPASGAAHGALSPGNSVYTLSALTSRRVSPWLELSVNIGYILDRARFAAAKFTNPAQSYAIGLDTTNRVSAGVGATHVLPPVWRHIAFAPYAELTSEWALHTRVADNPARLTVGTKAYFDAEQAFEAELGADIRLIGAPRTGSMYAGIAPWALFATFSWHSRIGALSLGENQVVFVPTPARPMVVIQGSVHDANAQVLQDVRLVVNGNPNTAVSANPNNGRYQTLPIAVTDANVTLEATAPGYIAQQQCVPARKGIGTVVVNFNLQRKVINAYLRVHVFNVKTGAPIAKARIFVPSEELTQTSDAKGASHFAMHPGRYELLVSAPGFALHRFEVDLPDETDLVINAGLQPLPKNAGRR